MRTFWIGLGLATLSACGFHLRTSSADVDGAVFLQFQSGTEDFARAVERALDASDVARARDVAAADWTLHLQQIREQRRTLTVTENIRAFDLLLSTEVRFRILDGEAEERVPSSRVRAERVYVFDRDNLLGNSEEEAVLRKEMQDELVTRILRVLETTARGSSA
jgi:LPS-assembly lipoprotein